MTTESYYLYIRCWSHGKRLRVSWWHQDGVYMIEHNYSLMTYANYQYWNVILKSSQCSLMCSLLLSYLLLILPIIVLQVPDKSLMTLNEICSSVFNKWFYSIPFQSIPVQPSPVQSSWVEASWVSILFQFCFTLHLQCSNFVTSTTSSIIYIKIY